MADAVEQFLDAYDPKVAKLAFATRKLVLRLVPDADEIHLHRRRLVTHRCPPADRYCDAATFGFRIW